MLFFSLSSWKSSAATGATPYSSRPPSVTSEKFGSTTSAYPYSAAPSFTASQAQALQQRQPRQVLPHPPSGYAFMNTNNKDTFIITDPYGGAPPPGSVVEIQRVIIHVCH